MAKNKKVQEITFGINKALKNFDTADAVKRVEELQKKMRQHTQKCRQLAMLVRS